MSDPERRAGQTLAEALDKIERVRQARRHKFHLRDERITVHELEAAAHKQGFETLSAVDRCILEPGGTLAMFGRKPSEDDLRQTAVMQRLDEIKALLVARAAR